MTYIFEDETTPMQQIVINNPGTIVIQSPSPISVAPPAPVFDDEMNQEVPEAIPQSQINPNDQATVYPYEDEVPEQDPNYSAYSNPSPNISGTPIPVGTGGETPVFDDELPSQDVAQSQMQNIPQDPATELPVQEPFYNDEQPPIEAPINSQPPVQEPYFNDEQVPQEGQQVIGQPAFAQLPPQAPVQQPATPIDPNAGMIAQPPVPMAPPVDGAPMDPNAMAMGGMGGVDPNLGMVDATTGQPIGQPLPAPGSIDPTTGMPVPGGMGMDGFSDEMNPEIALGNTSAVTVGAPVPLEDLSRLNELKTINSQLMRIKGILEKELSNPYNSVEDKLNEAIEYFRSIISNLDSFSMQIDDIIMKYKRFILTILTQINILKKQELDEKHGDKKSKKEDKKSKFSKDKK